MGLVFMAPPSRWSMFKHWLAPKLCYVFGHKWIDVSNEQEKVVECVRCHAFWREAMEPDYWKRRKKIDELIGKDK